MGGVRIHDLCWTHRSFSTDLYKQLLSVNIVVIPFLNIANNLAIFWRTRDLDPHSSANVIVKIRHNTATELPTKHCTAGDGGSHRERWYSRLNSDMGNDWLAYLLGMMRDKGRLRKGVHG